MPAISVRDIQVKDSDLVAGTHGRGFWILDDLSPLRQIAALRRAADAGQPYLVRPSAAVRVRFGTNEPTPWSPDLPAGENPPAGAVIDYFLPVDASGPPPVQLDIVDTTGRVVRSYSSDDRVRDPHPAFDPASYDRICQKQPTSPDCGVPLYWPAPPLRLSSRAGMHRFEWDMRYAPVGGDSLQDAGDVDDVGAVPHRSVHPPRAPWAPPGRYTLRLRVSGRTLTQPLVVRLDPRVKTPPAELAQLASLTREMYDLAQAAHAAYVPADTATRALERAGQCGAHCGFGDAGCRRRADRRPTSRVRTGRALVNGLLASRKKG
jgi:hypothetical protein